MLFSTYKNAKFLLMLLLCSSIVLHEVVMLNNNQERENKPRSQLIESHAQQISDLSLKPFSSQALQNFPAHGSINITSNAEFATHPNITGTGTAGDPFVFENYSITTTGIAAIAIIAIESGQIILQSISIAIL